jgi:hypothetical protein
LLTIGACAASNTESTRFIFFSLLLLLAAGAVENMLPRVLLALLLLLIHAVTAVGSRAENCSALQ